MDGTTTGLPGPVALVGYGEVGGILAEVLRAQGVAATAVDIKLARGGWAVWGRRGDELGAAVPNQRAVAAGRARRRSEEMLEAAETVREAGLEPWSASASAQRQAAVAALADTGQFGARGEPGFACSADWRTEADRLLASCKR